MPASDGSRGYFLPSRDDERINLDRLIGEIESLGATITRVDLFQISLVTRSTEA